MPAAADVGSGARGFVGCRRTGKGGFVTDRSGPSCVGHDRGGIQTDSRAGEANVGGVPAGAERLCQETGRRARLIAGPLLRLLERQAHL